jgi:hypothetical protein
MMITMMTRYAMVDLSIRSLLFLGRIVMSRPLLVSRSSVDPLSRLSELTVAIVSSVYLLHLPILLH